MPARNALPDQLLDHLRDRTSARVCCIFWGGLAVIDAAHLIGLPTLVLLACVAGCVTACSVHSDPWTALAVAGVAWLLVNAFVVNGLGTLHLVGSSDAIRAGVLAAAAVAGTRLHPRVGPRVGPGEGR